MNTINSIINFFQGGGVFMYPILLILAVGTAIIIERALSLSGASLQEQALWQKVKVAISAGKYDDAIKHCKNSKAPLCQVFKGGIETIRGHWTHEDLQNSMEEMVLEKLPPLEQRTHYLPTLANVATLLGLLGTIMGLIQAFAAVAAVDPSQKAALLAKGISVAMSTTAFGLIVAIPLLLSYTYLISKTRKIIEGIDEITTKFINLTRKTSQRQKEMSKSASPASNPKN